MKNELSDKNPYPEHLLLKYLSMTYHPLEEQVQKKIPQRRLNQEMAL
jgi:hypothetical protein